jgi:serine/threonine protein kinase
MEERYQIRGQLGQGGLGSVYRAFDTRMSREVAIKRIIAEGDAELQKEATEQLEKEAGSLASLQHPNIVTVYDVNSDEEGPYVVMELITGRTLDELVENAPLTFDDFKQFALQTQEGLIAAQELGLVHRDLKPGNLMFNWLPSGKFQVKIVDFGLAQISQQQAMKSLEEEDSVFGSIFFMAPEQFERGPIDTRVDMYAIGCVYYFALTGEYPFNGETGHDVMTAHLHHTVVPIIEVRPDLPQWICDWIMWHINRMPDDRPADSRRSLHVFLQNENAPPPPVPKATPKTGGPPAPKYAGAKAAAKARAAVRVHTGPVQTQPAQPKTQAAPKPLTPPEGFKPSVHTSSVFVGDTLVPAPDIAAAAPAASAAPTVRIGPQPHLATNTRAATYTPRPVKAKKKMDKGTQIAIWIAVLLVAAFIGFVAYKFGK